MEGNGRPCAGAESGDIQHRGVRTGCSVWKAQGRSPPRGQRVSTKRLRQGVASMLLCSLPGECMGDREQRQFRGKDAERSQDRGTRAATGWQLAIALQVSSVDTADTENLSNSVQPASPPNPPPGLLVAGYTLEAEGTPNIRHRNSPAGGGCSLGWESSRERPEPDPSVHRTAAGALPPGRPHSQRSTRQQIIPWEPVSIERCWSFGLLCAKTIHLLKLDNQSP